MKNMMMKTLLMVTAALIVFSGDPVFGQAQTILASCVLPPPPGIRRTGGAGMASHGDAVAPGLIRVGCRNPPTCPCET